MGIDFSPPRRRGLCRVQEEVKWRQQLLSQNDQVLQSLRVELKVYEKLDEEHGIPRGAGALGRGLSRPGLCVLGCPLTQTRSSVPSRNAVVKPHAHLPGAVGIFCSKLFSEGAAGNMAG